MKKCFRICIALVLLLSTLASMIACTGNSSTQTDNKNSREPSGIAPSSTVSSGSGAVAEVHLNSNHLSMSVGQQATLIATVLPENARNKKVIWGSSDEKILTVKDGVVKAISKGSANITVTTDEGGFTAVCQIQVKETVTPVTGVTLSEASHELTEGETFTLTASVIPSNATNKKYTYTSSNSTVARVNDKGVVTACSGGSVLITVTTEDGGFTRSCYVTVKAKPVAVTGISLNQKTVTMAETESLKLYATVLPENAANQNITWASSDSSIVKVENGTITALKAGNSTITVKTEEGGFTDTCKVTVVSGNMPVSGVTLSHTYLQMKAGENQTVTATVLPFNAGNKKITWASSDSSIVKVENGKLYALKAGEATITVTTAEGAKKATMTVSVLTNSDPIDHISLTNATEIDDLSGYYGGLRVKTTGELLFSPTLNELRNIILDDTDYNNYRAYIRFTYLPQDEDEIEFSYHSVVLTPARSKGAWVDFFLQGDGIDCGFCPTADAKYRIELVIVSADALQKGIFFGVYNMTVNSDYKNSPYYKPTPIGGQLIREEGQFIIRYLSGGNGTIQGETKQLLNKDQGSTAVTAIPNAGYQFMMWSDGVTTATRSGDKLTEDKKIYAYFSAVAEDSGVANMYIFTSDGRPITSKDYRNAVIVIQGALQDKYNITANAKIRGRGNSSWNGGAAQTEYDSKNSYRLKFDEKLKLLGVGDSKNRDWVLQSNKFDLSMLRNRMVWDLANKMGTLPYVPDCTWVQLYVNDKYRGMYMICELVEVANDRVEVDDSIASTDKGYLLEFDFRGQSEDSPYFYLNGYSYADPNGNPIEIVIKSNVTGEEDVEYIKNYLTECHNAIKRGKKANIEKLIDIPSLIDMYIIEEWSKDCDVGRASFFVQKAAGGKLVFTAPWDFDFGFGTYGPAVNTDWLVSEGNRGVCPWYCLLVEQSWFREAVVQRMEELSEAFAQTIEGIKAQAKTLESAADKNAYFWDMYGRGFHPYVSGQVSSRLYSYQDHIDFLTAWAEERWEILHDILKEFE